MPSSAGTLLITKNSSYLLIDFRYYEKAKNTVKFANVILLERYYVQLKEILESENIKTVLIESNTTSLDDYNKITSMLNGFKVLADSSLSKKIEALRTIKTKDEITSIKQAQQITDETFSYILNKIKVGITEYELMLDIEFFMRKLGSEGVAFDTIVVSGKNSSLPHGVPTKKQIETGDFITMDFGAVVNGYCSDMTRTVALGKPCEEQIKVYNTVLKAQKAALAGIKPDIICKNVDKLARDIIENAGYKGCFGHGLGHSVGLKIHESPCFNTRDETVLKNGMVLTVEPGIYLENRFGVRIEDMVIVTESGCENITKSPKELVVIN